MDRVVSLEGMVVRADDGRTLLEVPRLTVAPGDRIAVTGPSGSGKSLLLRLLAGRAPHGLAVEGTRTGGARTCGVVPQRGADALHPLVPLGRQLARVTGRSAADVAAVLHDLGLGDTALARRRPGELSGGQAQRAAIALAVLTRAPLIVADELTSALDAETRDTTLRLLDDVLAADQALVLATHDVAVATAVGGRHLVVREGRVSEVDPCG